MKSSIEIKIPSVSKYIFELSGEHETLPKAEVMASLEAYNLKSAIIEDEPGILVIEAPQMNTEDIKNRLALSHHISSHILSSEIRDLNDIKFEMKIQKGSFAVRAKRVQNFHENINLKELERVVADCVIGEEEVDLTDPENEIRVIVSKRGHMGLSLAKIDRSSFEGRKVQNRPYFSPVSLHPRLARALVNLSRIRAGDVIMDPFCGTGGIILEARLMDANVTGSDIDPRMVQGCRENLSSFGFDDNPVFEADVGDIPGLIDEVDAIVTDPPYGKSATTNREEVESLYERAFLAFTQVLKKDGYLSIALPSQKLIDLGAKHLNLLECHPMRVHRSLTRNFCVYQKV